MTYIPIHHLADFARKFDSRFTDLHALTITPLAGGYVGLQTNRLDAQFRLANGDLQTLSFVQKQTLPNEVRLMRLLARDFPNLKEITT